MQLNNTNGQIIILDKIDVNQNRIVYSIFEYGGGQNLSQHAHIFTTIDLRNYLNQETNFETLCYTKLVEEKEAGYSTSVDTQNWTIFTGTDDIDIELRVYVPSKLLNEVTNSGNDLDTLLKAMSPLSATLQRLTNGSMQYLIHLEDEHRTLLETYSKIIIEDKN